MKTVKTSHVPLHSGQQIFRLCLSVFMAGSVGTCLLVYYLGDGTAAAVQPFRSWLALWRLGVFACLIGGWPCWVRWYARRTRREADWQQPLLRYRWRLALILLAIEAILVQPVFTGVVA